MTKLIILNVTLATILFGGVKVLGIVDYPWPVIFLAGWFVLSLPFVIARGGEG